MSRLGIAAAKTAAQGQLAQNHSLRQLSVLGGLRSSHNLGALERVPHCTETNGGPRVSTSDCTFAAPWPRMLGRREGGAAAPSRPAAAGRPPRWPRGGVLGNGPSGVAPLTPTWAHWPGARTPGPAFQYWAKFGD